MPKPTFFNLPKEKQTVLIKAAKKEFSRVQLYEASISNIIKDAGIARGSFYQYFEDKEDAFFYLLEEHSKENKQKFIEMLKETDGQIFDTFTYMFQSMIDNFNIEENHNFFKNAFLYMNHKVENAFTQESNKEKFKQFFAQMSDLTDSKILNISANEEVFHVWQILMAITMRNLIQHYVRNLTKQEAINNFTTELALIKKGLYKAPENHS